MLEPAMYSVEELTSKATNFEILDYDGLANSGSPMVSSVEALLEQARWLRHRGAVPQMLPI
jgi:hypothetical protein